MSDPASVPLKVRGTRLGDLQRLSSTEENYLAYLAGLHMSEDSDVGSLTLSSTGNTLIGSFVNTFFNQAVGTHPGSLITSSTVTTNLYQIVGAGAGYTDADHRIPVAYVERNGVNVFEEMLEGDPEEDNHLYELIDRLNSRISTSDYPGVFKLGSSSPGGDYSLYFSGVFQDTQTDGTTVNYNLYRRTSMSAPSSVKIMSIKRSGGKTGTFQGLQEMTDNQMKVSLGQYAKNRSAETGAVGSYQLRSSTQGAPTAAGTWRAMGTATDTKKQTAEQNFAREIDVNYTAQYLEDFTADYAKDYVKTYTGDYGTEYSFDFTGNYSREYIRENVEETYSKTFTGDYVRDFFGEYTKRYTGDYTQDYGKDYSFDYTFRFTGNYTNRYTGDFVVDFTGNYTREYSRERDVNYTREVDVVGSRQAIEENYTEDYLFGPFDTSRTATYTGDYTNFLRPDSTRTINTYITTSREGETYTKTVNSAGEADFLGNYAFEARDYSGGGGTVVVGPNGTSVPGISFSPRSYLAVGSSTNNLYWEGNHLVQNAGLNFVPTDGVYRDYVFGGVTYSIAAHASPSFSGFFAVSRIISSAEVNYTKDAATFVGDYVGPKTYSRDLEYVETFTGDFIGDYTGEYTRELQVNFSRERASTFVSSAEITYTGDFVGNYVRDFVRTYVGDYTKTYTGENATVIDSTFDYSREYTRPRDSNYLREIDVDYSFDYGTDYSFDYLRERDVTYTSFSDLNITEDYARDYIGNYTGDFAVDIEEVYTGDYAQEYARDRDSNYTNEYLKDYARDYLFDYTTRYTGNFTGLTIQSSSTTIQTYTLYVRSA